MMKYRRQLGYGWLEAVAVEEKGEEAVGERKRISRLRQGMTTTSYALPAANEEMIASRGDRCCKRVAPMAGEEES
ncbi:hypothetical protein GW17_00010378 [Ensete ventricosum]|nr:hypothetical protein GW17_00010378 [Ensete ventricosum]